MRQLAPDDLNQCVAALPEQLGRAMVEWGGVVYVCGGHIRGTIAHERPSDIDVYTRDDSTAADLLDQLGEDRHETDFASTVILGRRPVQVITRWHGTPPRLIEAFDFTVCQAAVWYGEDGWTSLASDDFYPDLAARRIRFAHPDAARDPLDAGGTLMRLMKYTARGYSASPETVAEVAQSAVMANGGVEALVGSLRGIDPAYWPEWAREAVR